MVKKPKSTEIEIINKQEAMPIDREQLQRTVAYILRRFRVEDGSVSIAVVDNDCMRELKRRYYGEEMITDVLSFDLRDEGETEQRCDCEIVVNAEQAGTVAQKRSSEPEGELNLYIVHGLLHQLGYDDQEPKEAEVMHAKEDELLNELGFGKVFGG